VDHQIQDSPNIQGTTGERAMSFGFDKLGTDWPLHQLLEGRVESFDVPDLEWNSGFVGKRDEIIGFGNGSTNGFLDQSRNASPEKRRSDPMVVNSRRDDADGVHLTDQGLVIIEWGGVQAASDKPGLLQVGIHHTDEFDIRQIGKYPGMVLTQVPNPDNRHPQATHEFTKRILKGWFEPDVATRLNHIMNTKNGGACKASTHLTKPSWSHTQGSSRYDALRRNVSSDALRP
jgi:hypothetical protein